MSQPAFWDNQERAQETVQEKKRYANVVAPLDSATRLIEEGEVFLELGEDDPDRKSVV